LLLYYITDRHHFPGAPADQRRLLLKKIEEAAAASLDYIQLREKDLSSRDLESLAHEARAIIGGHSRLLINSRSDIALAANADGVHLTSTDISAAEARALWSKSNPQLSPIFAVSCHDANEVRMAHAQGANFAVLAPIYGKLDAPPLGLHELAKACGRLPTPEHTEAAPNPPAFPVLALGGISIENAHACLAAGAAGVAGIRIFQENSVAEVVNQLRALSS